MADSGHLKNTKPNRAIRLICALFFLSGFLMSCEEDLAKVNSNKNVNFPSQIINNAHIIQRDSGFIKLEASAPLIEKYELVDSPYVVARKGIKIEFFDKDKPNTPGNLTADFAKINEKRKFYEAKGNVKILTNDGQRFAMQTVYWDQQNKTIFTKDTVYVTDKDGSTMISSKGMRAKDDFSEYIFYNNSGDINARKIPEGQR